MNLIVRAIESYSLQSGKVDMLQMYEIGKRTLPYYLYVRADAL